MGQHRTVSSDMSDTFCNVLPLKVALLVSMIHIIYTLILCGYLLPYFIIYGFDAYLCFFQSSLNVYYHKFSAMFFYDTILRRIEVLCYMVEASRRNFL